jgi:hypothetical protein
LLLVFALASCNSQLDDINTNPNATEHPLPAYLLTGTLKQGADLYWVLNNNFNSSLLFFTAMGQNSIYGTRSL